MKKNIPLLFLLIFTVLHCHQCHAKSRSKEKKELKKKHEAYEDLKKNHLPPAEPEKTSQAPAEQEKIDQPYDELETIYQAYCALPSDINEHLVHLREIAGECSSAAEIGVRSMVSSWAILRGLAESQSTSRSYLGVDLEMPPDYNLQKAKALAESQGIAFQFLQGNDMVLDIPPVDLLFIDSLHTYCHLTFELEKFSPKASKYIAMHDTSPPWGMMDDNLYLGDYSEYDDSIDRTKRGLWPAVVDFLERHPEWALYQRNIYNNGFTVVKRVEEISGKESRDAEIENVLQNKIILCTGPSLNRKTELKAITENDMKHIHFKKIFLSTNDPDNADVVFKETTPIVEVLPCYKHQEDCANCIISSIKNAVNDPSCQEDDIILFKHESVFINDMTLVRKAIGKILEGYDAVTRFGNYNQDMTDAFFIKASSAKWLFGTRPTVSSLEGYLNCEEYFTKTVINFLPKVYRIQLNRFLRHWEHSELGFFHIFSLTQRDRLFWDRKNYNDLYR